MQLNALSKLEPPFSDSAQGALETLDVRFRPGGPTMFRPYVLLPFDHAALVEVVTGPAIKHQLVEATVRRMLDRNGFRHTEITEPVLTKIVNSAYPNGNPIPADPSKYQPATPFSSLTQLAASAAATRSTSKATSTTTVLADDAKPSDTATVTPHKKWIPLTNVLRLSDKAKPQSRTDAGRPSPTSDPVATVEKSTKGGTSNEWKENAAGAAEGDAS